MPDTLVPFPRRRRPIPRSSRRLRTEWPAALELQGSPLACTVADLSTAGAKLRLFTLPAQGSRVWLTLERSAPIAAEVVWRRSSSLGLRFLEPQPWVARLERRCPFAWSR